MSLSKQLHDPSQLDLWRDGAAAGRYLIRESARSRRLALRVHDTAQVEVVVPRGTAPRTIERFVNQHLDWIARRVAKARLRARPPEAFPPPVIRLAALDESWTLHLAGGKGAPRVRVLAGSLLCLSGTGSPQQLAAALCRWLMRHAQARLAGQLAQLAAEFGFRYSRLQLRLQRTRWGSCSARGGISLNLALLFQPPEVLRYLMIHELAHTRHMNHSRRFWSCVAACEPDCRRLDALLRTGWSNVPTWLRNLRGRTA